MMGEAEPGEEKGFVLTPHPVFPNMALLPPWAALTQNHRLLQL